MKTFQQAYRLILSSLGPSLGLSALFFGSVMLFMFVLFVLIFIPVALAGGASVGMGPPQGILLAVLILLGMIGILFLVAGFNGTAATALTPEGLQVGVRSFLRYGRRYFWPLAVLILLYLAVMAAAALGIMVLLVISWLIPVWFLRILLWGLIALSTMLAALLYFPIWNLGVSAIVLDGCHGMTAYRKSLVMVRQHPAGVAGTLGLILLIGLVPQVVLDIGKVLPPILATFVAIVSLIMVILVQLYSTLVWLLFYQNHSTSSGCL